MVQLMSWKEAGRLAVVRQTMRPLPFLNLSTVVFMLS